MIVHLNQDQATAY